MLASHLFRTRAPIAGQLTIALLGAFGYFALAAITIDLTSDGRNHATVWPADAIILALLLRKPRNQWALILLAGWAGNLAANIVCRGWMPGLLLYGAINMGQALLAAWALRWSLGNRNFLADLPSVGHFILWAGLLAPAVGAVIGSLASLINYGQPFGPSVVRWYTSNALGLLIFTPFLRALLDGSYWQAISSARPVQRLEAVALILLHGGLTLWVFHQDHLPLLFLPVSSLLLLSFRLGRLAAMAGVMIVAIAGGIFTMEDLGPMALIREGPVFRAIFFQVYLAVLLITTLPVAAIVSSRLEALNSLAAREETLRLIMAHSPDAILNFDEAGFCRWANGPLERLVGIAAEDCLDKSFDEIGLGSDEKLFGSHGEALAEGWQTRVGEIAPLFRPVLTLEASFRALVSQDHAVGTVVTLRDITARKASEVALTRRIETDDLTGVLNRRGFRERMKASAQDMIGPVALALIDIDHFKQINDTHGHRIGDEVLVIIANMLVDGTGKADSVSRLGGDEFAILFATDLGTARSACERIADRISRAPFISDAGTAIRVTISCGLAEHRAGMTRAQLFDQADTALYEVKRGGRNGVNVIAVP